MFLTRKPPVRAHGVMARLTEDTWPTLSQDTSMPRGLDARNSKRVTTLALSLGCHQMPVMLVRLSRLATLDSGSLSMATAFIHSTLLHSSEWFSRITLG